MIEAWGTSEKAQSSLWEKDFGEILNGFKLIVKLIRGHSGFFCLHSWISGDTSDPIVMKTEKHLLRSYIWSFGSWFSGSKVIAGLVQSLRLLLFHVLRLYQFCLCLTKLIVNGMPTQTQVKWDKSETYN